MSSLAARQHDVGGGAPPPDGCRGGPHSLPAAAGQLLLRVLALLFNLGDAFCQQRTALRAWRLAVGQALTLGGRTLSRIIASMQRDQRDWSADYRLFSRSPWQTRTLFLPVLREAVGLALPPGSAPSAPLWVAGDHTHARKSGRHLAGAQTIRDPMSPPWHVNFITAVRFFHLAVIAAPWRLEGEEEASVPARAIPVRFELSPMVKKPGRKATAEQRAVSKKKLKERVATVQARAEVEQLREDADAAGAAGRTIIAVLDGSFCNRVFFKEPMQGIELLCRCRKDAVLCEGAGAQEGRRFFSRQKFTPQQLCSDETHRWQTTTLRIGGKKCTVRYKEKTVYWQRGAGRRELRLIVMAPTGYRLHKEGRLLYRQPAYLLTTDLQREATELLQGYVDRWQIEVAHRELKDDFGIEETQVRNEKSVPRHPGFEVAVYAMLHLAALQSYGPLRTADYLPPAKWYAGALRPTLRDIVQLLRHQIPRCPPELLPPEAQFCLAVMAEKAAA
jgi:hypothetical protein